MAETELAPETPAQKALKALQTKTSPENFVTFLRSLTEGDEEWLAGQDLFAFPNFNVGFATKLFEADSVPLRFRQIVAKTFLDRIDLKKATKAAGKGDTKDLDRYDKLKELLEKTE